MYFLAELKKRNALLFWFGVLNILAAMICLVAWSQSSQLVNGVNAFIKPMKFYASIAIYIWTIGWFLYYLEMPAKTRAYSIMAVLVCVYESYVITWQAANGRLSHFNISSGLYAGLFILMGIAIMILTLWTGYICYLFFKRKEWQLPMAYVWGIRLGLLFFVIFALEGGVMAAVLKHTVGGTDEGGGMPLLTWSRQHGDLRVAHFLGIHSLQVLPLFGNYATKHARVMQFFSFGYLFVITAVLVQALMGLPLF